jgi:hypothetical protein
MCFFQFLEISLVYEVFEELDSPDIPDFPKPNIGLVPQHSSSVGSYSSTASDSQVSATGRISSTLGVVP